MNYFTSISSADYSASAPLDAMLALTPLAAPVRRHVAKVYRTLAGMMLCSVAAVVLHSRDLLFFRGGVATALLAFLCAMGVRLLENSKENRPWRLFLVYAFSFLKGASIAPLVEFSNIVSPEIVPKSLVSTLLVFLSFSISAIYSSRRSMIFLGGLLGSALSVLFWLSIANLFFGFNAIFNLEIYIGLIIFSGYIMYDTQVIIHNASSTTQVANLDELEPAVGLYINVAAVFIRILLILSKNKSDSEKESDRNDNRKKSAFTGRR